MPHLRRSLRLLVVAVLVVAGSFAAVSNAAAGETPRAGIDPPTLVALCERFQGKYFEDARSPYRYGCELSDGRINCLETTECNFYRLDDRPPFEESCERVGGRYLHKDIALFGCWTKEDEVVIACYKTWDECGITTEPNEQPMP